MNDIEIYYEDGDLLVVEKPVGMPSVKDPSGALSLAEALDAHRGREDFAPVVINRLDRGVGGIVILAKNKKSAAYLSAEVQDHQAFIKEYRAVAVGAPVPSAGSLSDLLFKDSAKNKTYVVKRMRRGVKEALLDYAVLDTAEQTGRVLSLLSVRLHTGRTHQIRVQMSHHGHPLVGDGKYGGPSGASIALHAWRMSFRHPSGKRLCFTSSLPTVYPWTLFSPQETPKE